MMVRFKVTTGASIPEVAKEFGVSDATVERVLSFAKKAGLVAQMEDQILQELLPAAKTAVKLGLEDTDNVQEAAKLGMDLMKALVPSMKKTPAGGKASNDSNELANYIANLRAESDPGNVIDGEIAGSAPAALPPAAESADAEGHDASPRGIAAGVSIQPQEPANLGPGSEQRGAQSAEGE